MELKKIFFGICLLLAANFALAYSLVEPPNIYDIIYQVIPQDSPAVDRIANYLTDLQYNKLAIFQKLDDNAAKVLVQKFSAKPANNYAQGIVDANNYLISDVVSDSGVDVSAIKAENARLSDPVYLKLRDQFILKDPLFVRYSALQNMYDYFNDKIGVDVLNKILSEKPALLLPDGKIFDDFRFSRFDATQIAANLKEEGYPQSKVSSPAAGETAPQGQQPSRIDPAANPDLVGLGTATDADLAAAKQEVTLLEQAFSNAESKVVEAENKVKQLEAEQAQLERQGYRVGSDAVKAKSGEITAVRTNELKPAQQTLAGLADELAAARTNVDGITAQLGRPGTNPGSEPRVETVSTTESPLRQFGSFEDDVVTSPNAETKGEVASNAKVLSKLATKPTAFEKGAAVISGVGSIISIFTAFMFHSDLRPVQAFLDPNYLNHVVVFSCEGDKPSFTRVCNDPALDGDAFASGACNPKFLIATADYCKNNAPADVKLVSLTSFAYNAGNGYSLFLNNYGNGALEFWNSLFGANARPLEARQLVNGTVEFIPAN